MIKTCLEYQVTKIAVWPINNNTTIGYVKCHVHIVIFSVEKKILYYLKTLRFDTMGLFIGNFLKFEVNSFTEKKLLPENWYIISLKARRIQ